MWCWTVVEEAGEVDLGLWEGAEEGAEQETTREGAEEGAEQEMTGEEAAH